ncbi:MAG: MBL fold metallo-hydrolase [Actinomycetota bacterium]
MASSGRIRRVLGSPWAASSLFVIEHRGVLSIVDTGSKGALSRIVSALRKLERRPEDVREIVLTHCHGDHTGEAQRLAELSGATVVAGEADAEVIAGRAVYPGPRDRLGRTLYRGLERFPRLEVGRRVAAEEDLEGGLRAIPTPGHTLGHLAVLVPDASAVVVGDAVWHLGLLRPSWKRFTQDPERNAESIRRLADLGADRVLIAHGPSVSGERLRDLAASLQ